MPPREGMVGTGSRKRARHELTRLPGATAGDTCGGLGLGQVKVTNAEVCGWGLGR